MARLTWVPTNAISGRRHIQNQARAILCLILVALGGCSDATTQEGEAELGDDSPDGQMSPNPETSEVPDNTEPSILEAQWSGALLVSGGAELPAHFDETDGVAHMVWDVARDFRISANATNMTVRLDWTGTGAVQLMANSPIIDGGWTEYSDPGPQALSQDSPLCIHLPANELAEGGWGVMLHTGASAQLEYTFNVTIEGEAEGPLPDGQAWSVSAVEFAQAQAEGRMGEVSATC